MMGDISRMGLMLVVMKCLVPGFIFIAMGKDIKRGALTRFLRQTMEFFSFAYYFTIDVMNNMIASGHRHKRKKSLILKLIMYSLLS